MNEQVKNSVKKVINNWLTGERSYTFETRGIRFITKLPESGEYFIVFYLKVDGFYIDKTLKQPIDLEFTSPNFMTQNLTVEYPDNPFSDAHYFEKTLGEFTGECYKKIADELVECPEVFTSDFLYWK